MPTTEFRILVNGTIVNKSFTKEIHNLTLDFINKLGYKTNVEIVDLH